MTILSSINVNQLLLIIPIVVLLLGTVIVVGGMIMDNRNRRMWHETARLALEKGQPLPPSPEDYDSRRTRGRSGDASDDIRAGLICIAVGAALYLFLGSYIGGGLGYVGAIPGFIGVALLLFGVIRSLAARKSSSNDDRPSQS